MHLSEQLARTFASMGRLISEFQGEVSRHDFIALVRIDQQDGVRTRDLADAEGLDPSTMSRRVASLTSRGLVERHPDPQDGRAHVLALTDAGRDLVREERARRVAIVTDALATWSDDDRADLARLLGQLTDTIETQRTRKQHP